ncbi:MAG: acyl-CoA thioesterase [Pseudomonadota bacterium]
MYPFIRFAKVILSARNAPLVPLMETFVSQMIAWPWDIDPWKDLNNGRTLTLYDLGRVGLGLRSGLFKVLREKKWGLTVAGASIRYRKRVLMFQRFEMRTRIVGWDKRFIYMEQSNWLRGECSSHILIRAGVVSKDGLVPPEKVADAMDIASESPPLPEWVSAWIAAEATRPWPPMQADEVPVGS